MDKNPLVSRLNKLVPKSILETRRFGRTGVTSIWVESDSILQIASILKNDAETAFDWLENLSVVEFEEALVVSYFLRSTQTSNTLVVRISLVPTSAEAEVSAPSVRLVWPMAEPMEREAEEMFGVQFRSGGEKQDVKAIERRWKGFPLRKKFVMAGLEK